LHLIINFHYSFFLFSYPLEISLEEIQKTSTVKAAPSTGTPLPLLRYGSREALAYAALRIRSLYGATHFVLEEIKRRITDFQPNSVLDFGSGIGTNLWMLQKMFGDKLGSVVAVDVSEAMLELAEALFEGASHGSSSCFFSSSKARTDDRVTADF
jgi:ribosomal protein RSM22 (predicted rRNA methylase)